MKNIVHVVGLALVALVLENFLSATWDNIFVAGRAWPFGVHALVASSFFAVVFVPFGFILARLVQSPQPVKWAVWSGLAYGVLTILLFQQHTSSSDPLDLFFFYFKFAVPALSSWLGASLSEYFRRDSKHA